MADQFLITPYKVRSAGTDVPPEEVQAGINSLAQQTKQTPEAVRTRLTQDGGLDRIRNRIRSEKTLDFLYHQSA